MRLNTLTLSPTDNPHPKFAPTLNSLQRLLAELQEKALPDAMISYINTEIDQLNAAQTQDPKFYKQLGSAQQRLLKRLEKDLKIVTKGHYQRLWMVLGMSVFGIPLGVAMGSGLGNMAFLGTGLPIGMVIGIGLGTSMDKKAAKEGRQLEFKSYGI
jgi:hypothetical protein